MHRHDTSAAETKHDGDAKEKSMMAMPTCVDMCRDMYKHVRSHVICVQMDMCADMAYIVMAAAMADWKE